MSQFTGYSGENFSKKCSTSLCGFYISNQIKNNHRIAILATFPDLDKNLPTATTSQNAVSLSSSNGKFLTMAIYRPNICLQNKLEALDSLLKKYKKATPEEARQHWNEQFEKSVTECTHLYRQGHCINITNCEIGLRTRTFHILAGSVLTVWSRVESLLATLTNSNQYRLQIIRVKTNDDQKIVGCVILNGCLKQIDSLLTTMSSGTRVQQHLVQSKISADEQKNEEIRLNEDLTHEIMLDFDFKNS